MERSMKSHPITVKRKERGTTPTPKVHNKSQETSSVEEVNHELQPTSISEGFKMRKSVPQPTRKSPRNHKAADSYSKEGSKKSKTVNLPQPTRKSPRNKNTVDSQSKESSQNQQVQQSDDSPQIKKKSKTSHLKDATNGGKKEKLKDVTKTKQVTSHSQPEPKGRKNTKRPLFQLVDEPTAMEISDSEHGASCSAPVEVLAEAERKTKWEMFGLVPPPFPVGQPPSLKNERRTTNEMLNVALSCIPPNLTDTNMSKERLAGILEGSKDIYTKFGLDVPKWLQDGIHKTLNLPEAFSITSLNHKPDVSGKGKGK